MKFDFETDKGAGARAKFGLIILQADQTLEPEFAQILAKQVIGEEIALYHSRIPMAPEVRPDTLAQMAADLPQAASMLPQIDLDVIGYGCTSASCVIGSEHVARQIQTVFPNAKCTDPLAAIQAACRHFGARRLADLSPYVDTVSAPMRATLSQAGFELTGVGSFQEQDDRNVGLIQPRSIAAAACALAEAIPSDALVISCTNLRCLPVLAEIEARIGIPVISSNQALAWHMLQLAGIKKAAPEFGRLFSDKV